MNKTTLTIVAAAIVVALAAFGIMNSQSQQGTEMESIMPSAGEISSHNQWRG